MLQIGYTLQQFIKPVYLNGKFQDDNKYFDVLTPFEKELFRQSDFIEKQVINENTDKTYYDGQY